MKKTIQLVIIGLFLSLTLIGFAQKQDSSTDIQIRIPLHIQYTGIYSNSYGNFGLAAWNIFSDVTAMNNETANLLVAGPLWEFDNKKGWLEIMGGYKRNENSYNDPVIDARFFSRQINRIGVAAEVAYFPRDEQQRFYSWLAIDTPISFGKYTIRVGFETENIISFTKKSDSLGIGPRIVFPILPNTMKKISPGLSSSATVTYQYRNDRDFVRCYLGLNYKFGK